MFLLVPAHPCIPRQRAVNRLLLLLFYLTSIKAAFSALTFTLFVGHQKEHPTRKKFSDEVLA